MLFYNLVVNSHYFVVLNTHFFLLSSSVFQNFKVCNLDFLVDFWGVVQQRENVPQDCLGRRGQIFFFEEKPECGCYCYQRERNQHKKCGSLMRSKRRLACNAFYNNNKCQIA